MCQTEIRPAIRGSRSGGPNDDCEREHGDIGPHGPVVYDSVISSDQLDHSGDLETKVGCNYRHRLARKREFRQSRPPGGRCGSSASPTCTRAPYVQRDSIQEGFHDSIQRLQADVVITNRKQLSSPGAASGLDRYLITSVHRGECHVRQARPPAPLEVCESLDLLGFLAKLVPHATPKFSSQVVKVIWAPCHFKPMEFFALSSPGHSSGISSPAAGCGAGACGRRFD